MDRSENSDPASTYRAIIDELVDRTPSLAARLLRQDGVAGKDADDGAANEMVGRLSAADREVLATFLDRQREGAFHDVLATLTWWMDCRDVLWACAGQPMPTGYEGGLHQDYVGRRLDWPWPADEAEPAKPRSGD